MDTYQLIGVDDRPQFFLCPLPLHVDVFRPLPLPHLIDTLSQLVQLLSLVLLHARAAFRTWRALVETWCVELIHDESDLARASGDVSCERQTDTFVYA